MLTTLCCLCLLVPQAGAQRVDGLGSGERALELAPRPAPDAREPLYYGRVIDAVTAGPLAGALVEAWTEEVDGLAGGFQRIGSATSGVDGRFELVVYEGGRRAEKLRVLAPDHAVLSSVVGERNLVLFPREEAVPRLRVTDLEGRPIAGARVTTTYTCAHDAPAFDLRSDAFGELELPDYALQDSLQELRVQAAGYQALKYVDGEPALALAARGEPMPVRLGRCLPFRVRLLDDVGAPLQGCALQLLEGEGFHVRRSDDQGWVAVDSRYGLGEVSISRLGVEPAGALGFTRLAPDGEACLRVGAERWPEGTPLARVALDWQGIGAQELSTLQPVLLHEQGWRLEPREEQRLGQWIEFPAGGVRLVFGEAFSGFEPASVDIQLVEGSSTRVASSPEREASIRIQLPEEALGQAPTNYELRVQAGEQTISTRGGELFVPADVPLVCLYESPSELRRLSLASAPEDGLVDLGAEGAIVSAHAPSDAAPARALHRLAVDRGELELVSCAPHGSVSLSESDWPGLFQLEGPVGASYLLRCRAQGCADVWRRGRMAAGDDLEPMRPPRLASLQIEAAPGVKILGYDAEDLEALVPGPLQLVARWPDGSCLGLELVLAEGEARALRLR